jgi:hypothetical protein
MSKSAQHCPSVPLRLVAYGDKDFVPPMDNAGIDPTTIKEHETSVRRNSDF